MKQLLILGIAFFIGASSSFAQKLDEKEKDLRARAKGNSDTTKLWSKGGFFNMTFGQTSLHNWAAGGLNSYNFNGLFNVYANYSKGKLAWDNALDVEYGAINQFAPGAPDSEKKWLKNSDRIELNSKVGLEAGGGWYYTALLNFRSQMVKGYDAGQVNLISDAMAPAYTTFAIGMDYKPSKNFNVFISPATYRMVYVGISELRGRYGFSTEDIQANKNMINQFGAFLKTKYIKDNPFGMENVAFQTDLALFSNYLENPQNVDVYWNTLIALKVNKYITANISTNLIYDDDITINTNEEIKDNTGAVIGYKKGPRVQFKKALMVGFSYKF